MIHFLNLLLEFHLLFGRLYESLILLLLDRLDLIQLGLSLRHFLVELSQLSFLGLDIFVCCIQFLLEISVLLLLQSKFARELLFLSLHVLVQLRDLFFALLVHDDLGSLFLANILVELSNLLVLILPLFLNLFLTTLEFFSQISTLVLFLLQLLHSMRLLLVNSLLLLLNLSNLLVQRILFFLKFFDLLFLLLDLVFEGLFLLDFLFVLLFLLFN